MEATGLRDVFQCVTQSIAAMEDIGLLQKPTGDAPVHRPTVTETLEFQHVPPGVKNGAMNLSNEGAVRQTHEATDPSRWKQNKQKRLRMEGKAYVSKRKKDGEMVTTEPRAMGPRCTSRACRKASNRLCSEISDDARERVFDEFWRHMNWTQRRLYVAGHVDCEPVERSRAAGSQSRRSNSLRYHLVVNGNRKQVCKNMFLSTLGVGEWSVLSWAQQGGRRASEVKQNQSQQSPHPISETVQRHQGQVSGSDKDRSWAPEPEEAAGNKSRVAKPSTWKQNQRKQLRMEGKAYVSRRKKDGASVAKAQRTMGPRCTSSACTRASSRFCADFSEETRSRLFTSFWRGMNWAQRKVYVFRLVDCEPVERTRAPWARSRRSVSLRYHLVAHGDRKQVCKKMFLSTLGIGQWSVLSWAQNASQPGNTAETPQRKRRKAAEHVVLKEFLDGLPKVPSYCGGTSVAKLFLEPVFSNMSHVYRHYYNHCSDKKSSPLSRQVFCAVFKKMDLGLCDQRRDQTPGVTGHLFNELWEEHCMERGAPGPQPGELGHT